MEKFVVTWGQRGETENLYYAGQYKNKAEFDAKDKAILYDYYFEANEQAKLLQTEGFLFCFVEEVE